MATTSPHRLSLLADDLNLSLLERQRIQTLNLGGGSTQQQDTQIARSLSELREGIEELEERENDLAVLQNWGEELEALRGRYEGLDARFHANASATGKAGNSEAAQQRPVSQARRNKSVRFRDYPNSAPDPTQGSEGDARATTDRNALFATADQQQRYTDDPSPPDQSHLDNQQLYASHNQTMQEQDQHLDTLGQSVRRQRMLGIAMGDELEEHNEMLVDVERGVDRHGTTLERARRRLGNVARQGKGGNWTWITIGVLVLLLVLLIVVKLPPMEVYYFGGYESHEPSARKDAAVEQLDVRH
ncbi:hypothetical protein LTR87_014435 [Friedmanniomyces endolithicus]|nr:hypothetical protein LTR87_014435 [Friedmanniomyces endolithicus]